jgi:DNA helicase-2/ATP-dependent DNA helicase PcrA
LVDEYQDTNRAQYIAINLISGDHKNICVVGDDAQSIYKWRGAEIRNILDFQTDFPGAKVVRLEQNYRSTKVIIKAADSVIRNNKHQISKFLWTDNEQGELITIIRSDDDREEAENIKNKIKSLCKKNFKLNDFAVLYRTNAQSLALENAFRRDNLPYIVVGNISFYKRKEIKDVLAYLKLLINQADSEALLRIINEPPRGIGNTSLDYFKNFAEANSITLFEAFTRAEEIEALQKRAKNSAINFSNFIKKYNEIIINGTTSDKIISYIEETGLLQMYKEINTEDSLDRWNNIQQFLSDISIYFRENEQNTLEDYISQISLSSEIDEADLTNERINLMTLHSAKGLEFPVVFISGLEQGLFPLGKAENDFEEIEEERRLFYVGMTRAKERIFLSYASRRMRYGEYSFQNPSIFIDEIDKNYIKSSQYQREDKESKKLEKQIDSGFNYKSKDADGYSYSQIPDDEINFKVGDKVLHSQFGVGNITGLSGNGKSRQAIVWFPSLREKKRLMLSYAKLKLLK